MTGLCGFAPKSSPNLRPYIYRGGKLILPLGPQDGTAGLKMPIELTVGRADRRRAEKLKRKAEKSAGIQTLRRKAS